MVAAGIVTAVLLVLSVLAVQGDGLQMGNLVLALFLTFWQEFFSWQISKWERS